MPMFEGWCVSEVLQSDISVEVGDGDPCGSKEKRVTVLETTELPGHIGIRASSQKKRWRDQQLNQMHLYECMQQGSKQAASHKPSSQGLSAGTSSVQQ